MVVLDDLLDFAYLLRRLFVLAIILNRILLNLFESFLNIVESFNSYGDAFHALHQFSLQIERLSFHETTEAPTDYFGDTIFLGLA
jgi:hypothetical protein